MGTTVINGASKICFSDITSLMKIGGCLNLVYGLIVFGLFCRDENDHRVRLAYAPLLICINMGYQYSVIDKFYNQKSVYEAIKEATSKVDQSKKD